jgi:hypothetical protein
MAARVITWPEPVVTRSRCSRDCGDVLHRAVFCRHRKPRTTPVAGISVTSRPRSVSVGFVEAFHCTGGAVHRQP